MTTQSEQFMQYAIEQASKGLGRTAPNPPVGAVVVRNGKVVGAGFHPAAGEPHAEVFALRAAGDLANGADIYVTLEPCCHQGRTGPCTEALVEAGVARVFVGTHDPNPQVAGKGIARLQEAGVEVVCDVLKEQCQQLIAPFTKHITSGLPYVVYKSAMTIDGHTATASGDSKWISSAASRALVHQLRDQVDGIMVGSGTVLADDPQLTTRLEGTGRDAVRIIFDGRLETSAQATVYNQASEAKSILVTALGHKDETIEPYRAAGAEIVQVDRNADGLDLVAALTKLGETGFQHILLEGGSTLAGAMLRAGLVDRVMIFVAPKLLGGLGRSLFSGEGAATIAEACTLTNLRSRQIDTDILLEGEVQDVYLPD